MSNWIINLLSGNYNEKQVRQLQPTVQHINDLSDAMDSRSDEEIKARSLELKETISSLNLPEKIKNKDGDLVFSSEESPLDTYLPEAFALVKQTAKRLVGTSYLVKGEEQVWNMVPYDVQIVGAITLHKGKIAEMKTGEGKTLVATMPAYLNALTGRGVHIITVNDYLASRDADQMRIIYEFLGLSVGCVTKSTPQHKRREEYAKDITYVENSELGFDYLRDNLVRSLDERSVIWRPLHYAIVDEVDSILIDESRTPLIISEPDSEPTEKYSYYAQIIENLTPSKHKKKVNKGFLAEMLNKESEKEEDQSDYFIDEKLKTATLSSYGIAKLEKILNVENIYQDLGYDEIHHIENALKAKSCYTNGKEYIIKDGEVVIVDENTGRAQPGRRFSQGLHQAIEAKEGVTIQRESKTLATITYQNFFKLYYKLSGMTGTATTEGEEFDSIYHLSVLAIPTNKPVIRVDKNDKVFFNQHAKRNAVLDQIEFSQSIGQPLLIGTSSISTSELVSGLLSQRNIKHAVLNAKHHEQEAHIIARAGQLGSVVVATNMAGRGTDIKLGESLNTQLALNYAQRVDHMVNGQNSSQKPYDVRILLFSEYEYDITIEAMKNHFSDLNEDIIIASYKSPQNFGSYRLHINFNTKRKSHQEVYASIGVSQGEINGSHTLRREFHYGLGIIGTEKHESRRIDNQLRGRAGRQGDPGFSVFYVALDDLIMRKMGGEKIQNVAALLLPKEELNTIELTQSQFTGAIVRAQKQIEGWNFSTRKHLFDYDNVVNKHRQAIYSKRDEILHVLHHIYHPHGELGEDVTLGKERFTNYIKNLTESSVRDVIHTQTTVLQSSPQEIADIIQKEYAVSLVTQEIESNSERQLTNLVSSKIIHKREEARKLLGDDIFIRLCANIALSIIDKNRTTHIDDMQYLREKVGLMGYAQLDPLIVYKKEGYSKYQILKSTINNTTASTLANTDFQAIADNIRAQQLQQEQITKDHEEGEQLLKKLKSAANESPKDKDVSIGSRKNSSQELIEIGGEEGEHTLGTKATTKLRPNDKVNVRYQDGKVMFDVKYKKVSEDILSGKAELIS